MLNPCPNGWSKKHRYQPRYDNELVLNEKHYTDIETGEPVDKLWYESLRGKYIHDICVKCGQTIRR